MSKEKRRVPKLRFPGFTEDWEQRKLIYIFNDFIVPMRDKPKVFSGTTPWTRIEDIEGRYINTSLSGQFVSDETIKSMNLKVIPKGSLIVSASATFGVVAIVNNDLITNQTFIGLVPNKDFDIDFLYSLFEAPTTKGKLLKLSAGSTIFYIARESFENLVLSVPSKEEQIKISKVFKSIDDSITLHQRKLNNLKLKKKALLQKLFPKNGERYPELRFPGFTDAWEQRKLSDILVERNEQQVETNEYPLMSFVQGHGVIPKGERYDRSFLVLDQSKKYKRTELGDFIYSSNNLETGSIGINKTGKAVISPVYSIFYGVSIGDSQFIGIMSLLPRFIAKMIRFRQGVVYGQWRIHEKDFLDISILIPSEAERTKITKLILSIEELITLHQRKLDHLQLQKKALLQQMFV